MNGIQVVVSTSNSLFDRLARRLGGITWTHAMLRFPTDWCVEGHPDDYHIIEAGFRHGVVEHLWDWQEYSKYQVYRLKPGYAKGIDWGEMLAFARGQIGKRYYYEGLILLIIRKLQESLRPAILFGQGLIGTGQVCTSLVDETYKFIGVDLIETEESSLVLPDQIAVSEKLELIETYP